MRGQAGVVVGAEGVQSRLQGLYDRGCGERSLRLPGGEAVTELESDAAAEVGRLPLFEEARTIPGRLVRAVDLEQRQPRQLRVAPVGVGLKRLGRGLAGQADDADIETLKAPRDALVDVL